MDIQHCITTKKEKDLRFLESEKRGSNESFLFFMQKKQENRDYGFNGKFKPYRLFDDGKQAT